MLGRGGGSGNVTGLPVNIIMAFPRAMRDARRERNAEVATADPAASSNARRKA